ncbi:MAG TPA: hypothetical protein VE973_04210 [Candidatus Limnocylindria bacterium]|nr:hypothetical protein [Candidatus Limnocylindria bacterium]
MEQTQLEGLAEKVKNKTATPEEALMFFEGLTDLLKGLADDLNKIPLKK